MIKVPVNVQSREVLGAALDKGQQWLCNETKKMNGRFNRMFVYCHGYSRMRPIITARGMDTLMPIVDLDAGEDGHAGNECFRESSKKVNRARLTRANTMQSTNFYSRTDNCTNTESDNETSHRHPLVTSTTVSTQSQSDSDDECLRPDSLAKPLRKTRNNRRKPISTAVTAHHSPGPIIPIVLWTYNRGLIADDKRRMYQPRLDYLNSADFYL